MSEKIMIGRSDFFAQGWLEKYKKFFTDLQPGEAIVLRALCALAIRVPVCIEELTKEIGSALYPAEKIINILDELIKKNSAKIDRRLASEQDRYLLVDPFGLWVGVMPESDEMMGVQFFTNNRGKDWTPFWFDGNQRWGVVDSWSTWKDFVTAYAAVNICVDSLLSARSTPRGPGIIPKFGFAIECYAEPTLGQWAAQVGNDMTF